MITLYKNNALVIIQKAAFCFYADDTVIYCFALVPTEVFAEWI